MMREIWMAFKRWWMPKPLDQIDGLDLSQSRQQIFKKPRTIEEDFPKGVEPEQFAVTSKPRHIPWSRRKKELEASARQKRRAREEFREQS